MAVSITSDQLAEDASGSVTVTGSGGGTTLLLALVMMTDSANTGTVTAHTINSTSFVTIGSAVVAGGSSPYIYGFYSYSDAGDTWPTTGDYESEISTTDINDASYVCELSGVDQTTPVTYGPNTQRDNNVTSFPTETVTTTSGDLVLYMVSASTGEVIVAPGDLGGVDSWTEEFDDTAVIGGGLSNGKVYSCITSQVHTAQSFNATTETNSVWVCSTCIVIKADVGGGASTILPHMMNLLN